MDPAMIFNGILITLMVLIALYIGRLFFLIALYRERAERVGLGLAPPDKMFHKAMKYRCHRETYDRACDNRKKIEAILEPTRQMNPKTKQEEK